MLKKISLTTTAEIIQIMNWFLTMVLKTWKV